MGAIRSGPGGSCSSAALAAGAGSRIRLPRASAIAAARLANRALRGRSVTILGPYEAEVHLHYRWTWAALQLLPSGGFLAPLLAASRRRDSSASPSAGRRGGWTSSGGPPAFSLHGVQCFQVLFQVSLADDKAQQVDSADHEEDGVAGDHVGRGVRRCVLKKHGKIPLRVAAPRCRMAGRRLGLLMNQCVRLSLSCSTRAASRPIRMRFHSKSMNMTVNANRAKKKATFMSPLIEKLPWADGSPLPMTTG